MYINSPLLHKFKSNSLAKDSFWALLGSGIGKGLSLIAGIFVARLLGSEVYGEYGTIRTTLIYIAIVSTFGFGYTATKYVAEYKIDGSLKLRSLVYKILMITFYVSTVLALLFIIFANDISLLLKSANLSILLKRYSILIIFNALVTTQIAIISGFKNFKATSIINIYSGVIVFVCSILFTYFWGLDGAILALLFSFLVQLILNQIVIIKELRKVLESNNIFTWKETLPLIKFSTPIALQESLYSIVHWATLWLLIEFSDYTQVGLSSAGALWQSVVIFIPAMLKNVMFSYLTTDKKSNQLTKQLIIINFICSLIPSVIVILLSSVISNFYGYSFNGVRTIIILSVSSSVFISISEVYCYKLISNNYPWFVFFSRFIRDIFILSSAYIVFIHINSSEAMYLSLISLIASIIYLIVIAIFTKRLFYISNVSK